MTVPIEVAKAPDSLPISAKQHAEEDVLNPIDADIRNNGLSPSDLDGAVVDMHVSLKVCTNCRQGFNPNKNARELKEAGILKQFSDRNPPVTINITNSQTTEVLVVKGGMISRE